MELKGNDALDKANKLFEFMETTPKKDSFSNLEAVFLANDGKHYAIVKENANYVLKYSDNPNPTLCEHFDYINGIQNKSKYSKSSYRDVEKMYNLMNIEYTRVYGTKLMKEALEEKKYVISAKKKAPEQPVDDFSDIDSIDDETSMDDTSMSSDDGLEDMGDTESPSESPDDYADVDPDDVDNEDPEKAIQKLSGKLAYELREFDDEEEYSDTAKFAMSMVTSALQTDKISDEDKTDIENKLENKLDSKDEEFPDGEEHDGVGDEITNEPEDVDEKGLDENANDNFKYPLKNLIMSYRKGNIGIKELFNKLYSIVLEMGADIDKWSFQKLFKGYTNSSKDVSFSNVLKLVKTTLNENKSNGKVLLTTEQYKLAVNEGLLFERKDPLKTWAERLSNMFNTGKIPSTIQLLKVIENNIENHDIDVDFYRLREIFEDEVTGSKVTSKMILDIVKQAMIKQPFESQDNSDDKILFDTDEELNPYEVDDDKILFDLDEEIDEDVYSQSPKKIKNKKYVQDYFGMDVGRVVGDDDADGYILEIDDEAPEDFDFGKIHITKQEPKNPFKYKS